MTSDEIRALDGEALTCLAWNLGLAPEDAWEDPVYHHFFERSNVYWEPYRDLHQADAVFRALRARGWTTRNFYYPTDAQGSVSVMRGEDAQSLHSSGYTSATEALELLRCACLAVASQEER